MSKHIDYETEAKYREWWLNNTGGNAKDNLTVRDYFAAKALQVYLTATMGQLIDCKNVAENAYLMADAMMKERAK
jgi:hypothetical protein